MPRKKKKVEEREKFEIDELIDSWFKQLEKVNKELILLDEIGLNISSLLDNLPLVALTGVRERFTDVETVECVCELTESIGKDIERELNK